MYLKNKILRDKIIDYVYNLIDKSKFPNDLIGLYLFAFHNYFPIFIYLAIVYSVIYKKYMIINFLLLILLFVLLLWVYLDGCLFTLLEFKLLNKKFTQHDIIYYIFNINNYSIEEKKKISNKINNFLILLILLLFIYLKIYL